MDQPTPQPKFRWISSNDPLPITSEKLSQVPDDVYKKYASSRPLHRRGDSQAKTAPPKKDQSE
jgi:hypothetical protein